MKSNSRWQKHKKELHEILSIFGWKRIGYSDIGPGGHYINQNIFEGVSHILLIGRNGIIMQVYSDPTRKTHFLRIPAKALKRYLETIEYYMKK
jgi:hypothetical protein